MRGAAWPTARLNSLLTRPRSIFPGIRHWRGPDRPRARGRPGRQLRLNGISGNAGELDIKEAKLDSTSKSGERIVKLNFASPLSLNLLQRSGGLSGLRGDVNITDPGLPKGSLQIPVIGSLNVDLLKDLASTKINAVLEGGKFDLSADISKLRDTPLVNVALAVDTLDLDKLAPPAAAPAKAPAEGKDESKPAQPAPAGRRRQHQPVGPGRSQRQRHAQDRQAGGARPEGRRRGRHGEAG